MADPVGLLALQGDFARHQAAFDDLATETRLVRRAEELAGCCALVVPGGESTALARLIDRCAMREPLLDFAREHAVMGTCAGLILMARELADEESADHGVTPLALLDCTVLRNGYGRQVDSFSAAVLIDSPGDAEPFPGVFIRAPRILAMGPQVEVVATCDEEPVAIRQGRILGLTFHPELTGDQRFHAAFLALAADG